MSLTNKEKRIRSKKQKVESLIQLNSTGNLGLTLNMKTSKNLEPNKIMDSALLEQLIAQHREKIKKKALASTFKLQMHCKFNSVVPLAANKRTFLFVSDLRDLIKETLLFSAEHYNSRWCHLSNISRLNKVIAIIVDDLTECDFDKNKKDFNFVEEFFQSRMSLINPKNYEISFEQELFCFQNILIKDKNAKLSKIDLILSATDLRTEEFALPLYNPDYVQEFEYSKDLYLPPSESSPLLAIDCEMVETCEGKELAWIAVVNEDLECIYETYVKPTNIVKNYLTKFSGITKKLLEGVTTRLSKVQRYLRKIIPPNAILVGHSLKYDLHALKMFHPFVIDTSVIFNLNNDKFRKTKLKQLAAIFLGRKIQSNDVKGHNPRQDAEVAMQLVSLKLQHGRTYGDVSKGWTMSNLHSNKMDITDQTDSKNSSPEINKLKPDSSCINGSHIKCSEANALTYFIQDFSNSNLFECANENDKRVTSVGICACSFSRSSCDSALSNKTVKRLTRAMIHRRSNASPQFDFASILPTFNTQLTNMINYNKHIADQLVNDTTGAQFEVDEKRRRNNKKAKLNGFQIWNTNTKPSGDGNEIQLKRKLKEVARNGKRKKEEATDADDAVASNSGDESGCKLVLSSDAHVHDQHVLVAKLRVPTKSVIIGDTNNPTQVKDYSKLDKDIKCILEDMNANTLMLLVFTGKKEKPGVCFIKLTNS